MNIKTLFQQYHISLTTEQEERFQLFLNIFQKKNAVLNLSAIRDEEGIIEKHFIDSILLSNFVDLSDKTVVDVGTGGGFPWVPLAIMFPTARFVCVDARRKKVDAINEFVQELGLKNIKAVHGRAEDLIQEYKRKFDIGVSRATAYFPQISEWVLPFVKKWGSMYLYKLPNDQEMIDGKRVLDSLQAKIKRIYSYQLMNQERVFIQVVKNK